MMMVIIIFLFYLFNNFGQGDIRPLTWPSVLKKREMHKFERKLRTTKN